jgi:hypothetical protein
MEPYEKIDRLVELVGAQALIDELKQWMSYDQLNEFADDYARNWEIDLEEA